MQHSVDIRFGRSLWRFTPLICSGFVLVAVLILSVGIGSVYVSPARVIEAIFNGVYGNLGEASDTIIWKMRLPRVLLTGLVGAALAVSGAAFQALFRNPLADPYLLGVASGAGFGATLVMVFAASFPLLLSIGVPLAAFVVAFLTVMLVLVLAKQGRGVSLMALLLSGVMMGSVLTALTSFMMLYAREQALSVLAWLMGSFSFASWSKVFMILPVVVLVYVVVGFSSRALNLLQLGEEQAMQLGLPVERFKLLLIAVSTLATAVAVSVSGIIGFVGLIIPHAVRLAMGADYRRLIPLAAVWGALFLILADLLARTLMSPNELPIGVVTALVGGPFFLHLLRQRQKRGS
jgi:iron complex transport system permease protein